jgi:zinc transporter ZupT
MILTSILVLFLVSMLGSGILFLGWNITPNRMKLLLSFSASYLLSLTFLHLLPEAMADGGEGIGVFILCGFLLQIILDYFSHGVEHGHAHAHNHVGAKFYWMVSISLWIHAFIEGMPFGLTEEAVHHGHEHHHHGQSLLMGISFHKFTESFVFAALLLAMVKEKWKAFVAAVFFAMVAPAGALIFHFGEQWEWFHSEQLLPYVMAVLMGIILHVSTMILFEAEEGHRFNRVKFLIILLGFAAAFFL